MTNPFERHGVKWLSPSSLNLFQGCPAFWVAKYLFQVKDEFGAAAKRGTAVEAGLDAFIYGQTDAAGAVQIALRNFALNTDGLCDDDHEAERSVIPDMVKVACDAVSKFTHDADPLGMMPKPNARQLKIEHRFDGIEVPLIGYVDYIWDDWGLDLKTTMRCPSSPKADHVRQVAVYSAAKQKPFKLLYVTNKKSALYPVFQSESEAGLKDMHRIALAMRKVLDKSEDRREAAEFFCPDFTEFYWSEQTKQEAARIWA